MSTLHFDCFAGISGDMALGAFVDLGVNPDALIGELSKLGLRGWKLRFERDERCGIGGTHAFVDLVEESPEHHHHEHDHDHDHHHAHNAWKDIRALIEGAALTDRAKRRALDIFTRIAVAEASVHGVPVEEVAFHEVGALDSIIDIVGAAVCLDILNPDRITASEIELGGGTVHCAHGLLPVPAPATVLLTQGLPVHAGGFQKEMTTPTGAAILASCVDTFLPEGIYIEQKTGYGIGNRIMERPNVLRVSLREEPSRDAEATAGAQWKTEELVLVEANIDDMSGEELAFLMERLFEAGSLDVTLPPCVMKKSRPGTIVAALCTQERLSGIRKAMFDFSSTIGYRESVVRRISLPREEHTVRGSFGQARVKTCALGDGKVRSKIEFEDRARVAREQKISLADGGKLIEEEGTCDE